MSRFTALLFVCISLILASFSVQAEVNPFKKAKVYSFDRDVSWYFKEGAAVLSASRRDGGDTLYYHLHVNKERIRLRLSKNDPSGELENTRGLQGMTVNDVIVDGRTLPLFEWCLQNQERPGKKIKSNAIVINDTCINPGNGDFVINLDHSSKNVMKFGRKIEFVVEPYSRPIKLSFSLSNYAEIIARVDKPEPAPVVRAAPAPKAVAKPSAPKPKPKPRPKAVAKTCKASPPAEYASVVKSVDYPCSDSKKKANAENAVNAKVAAEQQKRQAAAAARKQQEAEKKQELEAKNKVEEEWEKRQAAMWIKRCQKHWAKGGSPCYCEKYIDQAPAGVKSTCGR